MRNWPHSVCSRGGDPMTATNSGRAHLIAGGFPPGSMAGHDHDYARLRLLELLAERDIAASVANDFADIERWLPVSRLLITYVAGPYPDAAQCRAIERWLEAGGNGGVTYFALGHCHNPAIRAARTADPADTTAPTFRGAWESYTFMALLRNAIACSIGA